MAESDKVTTSGHGSCTSDLTPFYEFNAALQVSETINQIEEITSSTLSDKMPHFVIQKRFYVTDDFESAVKSIQKGHDIYSLWHHCTSNEYSMMGNGKEGSQIDAYLSMTEEKFQALSHTHQLGGDFYVIQNTTVLRIINDEQTIEVCYPLLYWFVLASGQWKISETKSITLDDLPMVFPHAIKMLGRGTQRVLVHFWKKMQGLEQSLDHLRNMQSVITGRDSTGELVNSMNIGVEDLPLTQDPIIVTHYDTLPDCDGDKCLEFGQTDMFDTGNWLFSFI